MKAIPEINVSCTLNQIRVIAKLPNSEQSYKGNVKTHKYIKGQNQSTTGKTVKAVMTLTGIGISKEMVG